MPISSLQPPPAQPPTTLRPPILALFGLTVFLGAFLLFAVEPLIGKFVLPWFGGSPAVWTTCLCFFQAALLLGYAYAHLLTRCLPLREQVLVHGTLLAAALLTLPIIPATSWQPTDPGNPTGRILLLLAATVGLPFALLAATSPLLQTWFSRVTAGPDHAPYRLYALSNLGSLLALWGYLLLAEPFLTRQAQAYLWSAAMVLLAGLLGIVGWQVWQHNAPPPRAPAPTKPAPKPKQKVPLGTCLLWLTLPLCATVMLLAVTNMLCQDVAVVPFLWVVPLTVYLLSFVICFDSPRWYWRRAYAGGLALAVAGLCQVVWPWNPPLWAVLTVGVAALFVGCMVCHGELARLQPPAAHATLYYLLIAAGGAMGGLLVTLVAPLLFRRYLEMPLSFLAATALLAVCFWRDRLRGRWSLAVTGTLVLGLYLLWACNQDYQFAGQEVLTRARNFYGILSAEQSRGPKPEENLRRLRHGRIVHGSQVAGETWRRVPTAYYGPTSGIGRLLQSLPPDSPRRIGVVGLGVGTLAAYGQPGDTLRFYEINPDVETLARTYFTYLADCPGKVEMVLGDGRLALQREPGQHFDVLVLDAFSGDAIPVHLLTTEALALYRRHLRPGGTLAVHVTNRYLDLVPVLAATAAPAGWQVGVVRDPTKTLVVSPSLWMLLTPDEAALQRPALAAVVRRIRPPAGLPPWTDDHATLLPALKWEE